jgi:hypothetical protein
MENKSELDVLLARRFWDDMEDKIRGTIDNAQYLFHYTSLSGFRGIIESNSFWVSKSNFLNDAEELYYINKIIGTSIEKLFKSIEETYNPETVNSELAQLFERKLRESQEKFNNDINLDDFEVYVLSLTGNEDSLALWYNYSTGDGYNLGFDTKELLNLLGEFSDDDNNEFFVAYGKVIYNKEDQEQILHDALFNSFKNVYQFKDEYKLDEFENELPRLFFSIITACSIFFKQEAFRQEEEYRVAFTRRTKETEVNFREKNGILIPYISVHFEDKLPIKKVTIGPKNNISVAKNGIEYFLRNRGYDLQDITVDKSEVTLRY